MADRKPIVIGSTGQQQQIQAGDTLQVRAPTTASASLNLPAGTAPTSPADGDAWTTTAGLYVRISGVTVGPLSAGGSPGGSSGQVQYNNAGVFGGFTAWGDATINTGTGVVTVAQAAKWTTGRTITLTGDTTGVSGAFDGSGNLSFATTGVQAAKWTTGRTLSITGDLAYTSPSLDGSGNVTAAGTLATVNSSVGSFTNANITVNAKGLITAAANGSGGTGTVTHTGALTSGQLVFGNGTADISVGDLSGDVSTSGSGVTTLASVVGAATNLKITYNAKGLVTAGAAAILASADFANQGTTTTLLHGNAAGNPAFGSVVTGDITNAAVTLAKIANAAANTRFVGSGSAGSGSAYAEQTISAGAGITITPNASGITVAAVGSGISGAAPYIYTNAPFANVTSLLHFDGTNGSTTITDQVLTAWTAVGSAAISTAQSVYGGASLLVPSGSNSSVKHTTSSGFDVGTGDWAIEFNWRFSGTPQTSARIFQSRDGDIVVGIGIFIDPSGFMSLALSSNGSAFDLFNGNAARLSLTAWNAVIIQRRGLFLESFVNGTLTTIYWLGSSTIFYSSSDTVVIGGNATGTSRSMNAYIDEFRFTKGAHVMEPGNPVLPVSPFPNS